MESGRTPILFQYKPAVRSTLRNVVSHSAKVSKTIIIHRTYLIFSII